MPVFARYKKKVLSTDAHFLIFNGRLSENSISSPGRYIEEINAISRENAIRVLNIVVHIPEYKESTPRALPYLLRTRLM